MKASLVSITKPILEAVQTDNPEDLIVYTARVSNPSNQTNFETSSKLIHYLIKHKHWSPFEMVDMTVEIVTSRAIAAQILRHRSFSFQEFSQRYSVATKIMPIQLRKQADKNRQSSEQPIDNSVLAVEVDKHIRDSQELYSRLIDAGVAKECARMVLPLSTETTLYMKGSVRSWIHYLQIRTEAVTQLEHRLVAEAIDKIFQTQFPSIHEAIHLLCSKQ